MSGVTSSNAERRLQGRRRHPRPDHLQRAGHGHRHADPRPLERRHGQLRLGLGHLDARRSTTRSARATTSTRLDAASTSALDGGTIRDAAGNDATLTVATARARPAPREREEHPHRHDEPDRVDHGAGLERHDVQRVEPAREHRRLLGRHRRLRCRGRRGRHPGRQRQLLERHDLRLGLDRLQRDRRHDRRVDVLDLDARRQLADGHTYTITARATDSAGNQSTTTRTFVFDVTAPAVTNVTRDERERRVQRRRRRSTSRSRSASPSPSPARRQLTLNTTPARTADFTSAARAPRR